MRGLPRGGAGAGRTGRAAKGARRLWPYVLMAWERWQSLSPEQKDRYRRQARGYADRGRRVLEDRRKRPGGRR